MLESKSISLANTKPESDYIICTVRCNDHELQLILPAIAELRYRFVPTSGLVSFDVTSHDAIVVSDGIADSFAQRFVINSFYKPKRKLVFEHFVVALLGPRSACKRFHGATKFLRDNIGALDGPFLRPEVIKGWSTETVVPIGDKVPIPGGLKAVIVCHLYYMDLLDEVVALISSCASHFDVVITMPVANENWRGSIEQKIPGTRIVTFENIGRDIRPFLKLLEQGLLDDYDLICKIHGKKSKHDSRQFMSGDIWRRRMFLDLLGSQSALDETLHCFATDPGIGMIGSSAFRCPGPTFDAKAGWLANRGRIIDLAARMDVSEAEFKLDFYAGSMFWVRRSALEPLRRLALADIYFEPELGLLDGGPEHAIERIFGTSVIKAGCRLKDVSAVFD